MEPPAKHAAVDEKLYGAMMDFIHRTVSLRRAWILYGRGNVMLTENLNTWRASADHLFRDREYIEITTAGNRLFFGDILLGGDSPFARELVENLRRLIVRRITLLKGIEGEELYLLMDMLSQESRQLLVKGGPVAFLRDAGVKKIRVIENVYLKRVGQTGEIVLDEGKLTLEDLNFIRGQLKNMLSLAREGFELRAEERGLLAEVAEHPTFMGELLRELSAGEPGTAPPPPQEQGRKIAEMLGAVLTELRRGGKCDEAFLRKSFSDALKTLDEPTMLETLAAEFETAGPVAPLLDEEVFARSREGIGGLVLAMHRRDSSEEKRAALLLRKLIPDEGTLGGVLEGVQRACAEQGASPAEVEARLRAALGPLARFPSEGEAEGEGSEAREIASSLAPHAASTTEGLGAALAGGEIEGREGRILAELLRGSAATPKLAARAAARIKDLVKAERGGDAAVIFRSLIALLQSGEKAASRAARDEFRSLNAAGLTRSLLRASATADEQAELMGELVRLLPAEDPAAWGALVCDDVVHDILVETAKRQPQAVAALLRKLATGDDAAVVARAMEIVRTLPPQLATPIMTDLCRNPDAGVRLKAVVFLGKTGDVSAVPLLQVLVNDADGEVRKTAIPLLGLCGGDAAVGTLMEIVADAQGVWGAEERVLACRALARCGNARAVPSLVEALRGARERKKEKESELLRSSARFALESIGGGEAQEALREDAAAGRTIFRRFFGGR